MIILINILILYYKFKIDEVLLLNFKKAINFVKYLKVVIKGEII